MADKQGRRVVLARVSHDFDPVLPKVWKFLPGVGQRLGGNWGTYGHCIDGQNQALILSAVSSSEY